MPRAETFVLPPFDFLPVASGAVLFDTTLPSNCRGLLIGTAGALNITMEGNNRDDVPFQVGQNPGFFQIVRAANGTAAVAATGTLTLTGNALNTETVTIDGKTYFFQTALTDLNGNVLIGATASDTLDNLIAAINLGAGAGTAYASATTVHPTVSAATGVGDTMDVTAKTAGAGGNSITTTETLTNGSWGGATLSGGTNLVPAAGAAENIWAII